ncbi:FAD/NAD(P)-binding domain-containing protein [Xylariaceae sp. FL0804]|nr:FAD/NAD(P)-binding domain-containing protein [Xylariaceae sp. FL0804]
MFPQRKHGSLESLVLFTPSSVKIRVVVIRGGNVGSSAATTAAQAGARVWLVEKAPFADAGRNTYCTAAGYRTCFDGLQDLLPFIYQADGTMVLPQNLIDKIEMKPYTKADFHADINGVTKGRADPALAEVLVDNSREAAFLVDGKYKFQGGMVMNMIGNLRRRSLDRQQWHMDLARKSGVDVQFGWPAVELVADYETNEVIGVKVFDTGSWKLKTYAAYLAPGWDPAHVRGNKYSTGDGLRMAEKLGAMLEGNFSGCHSVAWDGNSPRASGDRHLTNRYTKSGYPLGIMLNTEGRRFVDDGFDVRNLIGEYADDVTTNLRADTIEGLADILVTKGLKNKPQLLSTISDFNEACYSFRRERPAKAFDSSVKDGMSTQGTERSLAIGKDNWVMPIERGPFQAIEVTCGIFFTFRGLGATSGSEVLSAATRRPVGGLWGASEVMSGLFWDNYDGLTIGTAIGRIAGKAAAERSWEYHDKSL